MKKSLIITISVVVVILLAAILTCPGEEAHKAAVDYVVSDLMDDDLSDKITGENDIWSVLTSDLGDEMVDSILDSRFYVRNMGVFSLGYIRKGTGSKMVSLGCFGHVFTFDKEDLERVIDAHNESFNIFKF